MQGSSLETALRSCWTPSRLEATLFDSAQKYGATLYRSSVREKLYRNYFGFLMINFHCTAYTGVKHFLVDASVEGVYHFLGPKQQAFKSIQDLLNFYR